MRRLRTRRRRRSRVFNEVWGGLAALGILAVCWLVFGGPRAVHEFRVSPEGGVHGAD